MLVCVSLGRPPHLLIPSPAAPPTSMSKTIAFPPGTFRASAKVVHEKKEDSDDDEPKKYSHELFTEYTFMEDGSYVMHGYPPINEKGKIVVKEKVRLNSGTLDSCASACIDRPGVPRARCEPRSDLAEGRVEAR